MPSRVPATPAVYGTQGNYLICNTTRLFTRDGFYILPLTAHAGFPMSNSHHHQQPQYRNYHFPAAPVHSRSSSDSHIPPMQTPAFNTQYEPTCAEASQEPPVNYFILQTRTTPNSASSEPGASSDGQHRVASPYTPTYITSQEQAPGHMMPHQQQHIEYGGTPWELSQDFSQVSIYPRYKMMMQPSPHQTIHMPPAPDAWLERQMAAQLQGESASQEHSGHYPTPLDHKGIWECMFRSTHTRSHIVCIIIL